jgi:hypothetical protein
MLKAFDNSENGGFSEVSCEYPSSRKAAKGSRFPRAGGKIGGMEVRTDAFWKKHPGVVWSNRRASDSTMIANALLRPNFHLLLDIAAHFGLSRLRADWETLRKMPVDDPADQTKLQQAAPIVERCLRHMEDALRNEEAC